MSKQTQPVMEVENHNYFCYADINWITKPVFCVTEWGRELLQKYYMVNVDLCLTHYSPLLLIYTPWKHHKT